MRLKQVLGARCARFTIAAIIADLSTLFSSASYQPCASIMNYWRARRPSWGVLLHYSAITRRGNAELRVDNDDVAFSISNHVNKKTTFPRLLF